MPSDAAQRYLDSLRKPPVSRISTITVTGTTFPLPQVVAASERRIGLVFYNQSAQGYQISFQNGVVPPCIFVNTNGPPIELWLWKHGGVVQMAMYGSSTTSFANVTVLEVFRAGDYVDSPFPQETV